MRFTQIKYDEKSGTSAVKVINKFYILLLIGFCHNINLLKMNKKKRFLKQN